MATSDHPSAIAARLGALRARLVSATIRANSPERVGHHGSPLAEARSSAPRDTLSSPHLASRSPLPARRLESPIRRADTDAAATRRRVAALKAALNGDAAAVSGRARRASLGDVQAAAEQLSPARANGRRDEHVVYDERGRLHGDVDLAGDATAAAASTLHARMALFKAALAGDAPAPATPQRGLGGPGSRSLSPPLQRHHHGSPGFAAAPAAASSGGAVRLAHARMMLAAPPPAAPPQAAGERHAEPLPARIASVATAPAPPSTPPRAQAAAAAAAASLPPPRAYEYDASAEGLLQSLERTSVLRSETGAAAAAFVQVLGRLLGLGGTLACCKLAPIPPPLCAGAGVCGLSAAPRAPSLGHLSVALPCGAAQPRDLAWGEPRQHWRRCRRRAWHVAAPPRDTPPLPAPHLAWQPPALDEPSPVSTPQQQACAACDPELGRLGSRAVCLAGGRISCGCCVSSGCACCRLAVCRSRSRCCDC